MTESGSKSQAPANDNQFKLAYSPDEAAKATGLGRSTIFAMLADGRLTRAKVGSKTIIPRSSLEQMIAKAVEEAAAA